jgi:hypothetical protein
LTTNGKLNGRGGFFFAQTGLLERSRTISNLTFLMALLSFVYF